MVDLMEVLQNLPSRIANFALSLQFWDVLDILIIAYLIYRLLLLVRKTNSSCLLYTSDAADEQ